MDPLVMLLTHNAERLERRERRGTSQTQKRVTACCPQEAGLSLKISEVEPKHVRSTPSSTAWKRGLLFSATAAQRC